MEQSMYVVLKFVGQSVRYPENVLGVSVLVVKH